MHVVHGYLSPRQGHRKGQYISNREDRKSTRLNSSHLVISYAVFCLKKKKVRREAQRGLAPFDRKILNRRHVLCKRAIVVDKDEPILAPQPGGLCKRLERLDLVPDLR